MNKSKISKWVDKSPKPRHATPRPTLFHLNDEQRREIGYWVIYELLDLMKQKELSEDYKEGYKTALDELGKKLYKDYKPED